MMERAISTVSVYFNYVGLRRGMANRDKQRQIKKAATLKVAAFCFMLDDVCRHPTARKSSVRRGLA